MIERDSTKRIVGYKVTGHAGFDECGKDIVCAAVSVLTQAVLVGLAEEAGIDVDYSIDEVKGSLSCTLPSLEAEDRKKADLLLNTMYISLKSLQEEYPENILMIQEEV